MKHTRQWRFADFLVDEGNAQLWQDGKAIKLRPKAFDVLCYLLEHANELVTKDELLAAIWPGLVVGDTNLQLCLSEIRKAFAEDPSRPRFIETVHRRGYRFHTSPATEPLAPGEDPWNSPAPVQSENATQRIWDSSTPVPVVGREVELAHLSTVLQSAGRGQRQFLMVSGEPGIGKTTLVRTFLRGLSSASHGAKRTLAPPAETARIPAQTEPTPLIAYGQCAMQYGAEVAYLPLYGAMDALIRYSHPWVLNLWRKYAPSWVNHIPSLLPATQERVSAQTAVSKTSVERLFKEFTEALEALAAEGTVVLWLDDLHDSDASTLDLLGYLARRQHPARLLIIGTYRPAKFQRAEHSLKQIQQTLRERDLLLKLEVSALSPAAIEALVRLRLQGEIGFSAPTLANLIHSRTEGNPLFVHHVMDDLLGAGLLFRQDGSWRLDFANNALFARVPATLEDMLAGQIGNLAREEQEVLEVASAIGIRFSVQAVSAVYERSDLDVEELCERLAGEARYVQRDGTEHWPNGQLAMCYRFRHALHQEVAYRRIPALRRAVLHQKVGEHRERSHAAELSSVAVELASHFERSRDYPRAVRYCLAGFQQASRRSAFKEGFKLVSKGLALLENLPEGPERNEAELGRRKALVTCHSASFGHASQEVGVACRRALELCGQLSDNIELFPVLAGLFGFYLVNSEYTTAHQVGLRLLALAQQQDSRVLALAARVALGIASWHMGNFVEAREHLDQRSTLYRTEDHLKHVQFSHDPTITSLSFAAPVYWYLGYPDKARRVAEEGIALARTLAHVYSQGVALLFGARPFQECRELSRVRELVEDHEITCRDQEFTEADARRQLSLGWLLAWEGNTEEGIQSLRAGLTTCDALGTRMEKPYHLTMLAEAHRRGGRHDESLALLDEALRLSLELGEAYYQAEIYRLRAENLIAKLDIELARNRVGHTSNSSIPAIEALDDIEHCLNKALAISRAQQARSLELRAAMSQVRLYQRTRSSAESHRAAFEAAVQSLRATYDWFTEGFDTPDLIGAKAILEELG